MRRGWKMRLPCNLVEPALGEDQLKGMRPTYLVFHKWLAANRRKIAAGRDRTVIYSGMNSGRIPIWTRLGLYERFLSLELGTNPRWEPIQTVLTKLPCTLPNYRGPVELPYGVAAFKTMWDFACHAKDRRFVTTHESQQIWKNLSAWYVKNAVGETYIFVGSILKKYPDLLLAEIPVLMKNKSISAESQERVMKLIPDSKATWEQYRADSAKGRTAWR